MINEMNSQFTCVEQSFFSQSNRKTPGTKIPYILVDSFPKLGLLTCLRFFEWVNANPEGVISLPTGKTPEYFIKWVTYMLENWEDRELTKLRNDFGLHLKKKPDLRGLQFVQIDEFYPINCQHHNSFFYYVHKYYIEGLGLDIKKAQLIDCEDIPRPIGYSLQEIFPDNCVKLSLRVREYQNEQEELQQDAIMMVDEWCSEYEALIREKGGIGFFLGGIGPDGHIAFNVRGTDHNSTTRLTQTNFETQAAAAVDLGGIEISRDRLVITIGLSTITYNPGATAIIIAAGEAKADIVKASLESSPTNRLPATVLQSLSHSRFYITRGASSKLKESVLEYYTSGDWDKRKKERFIIDLCKRLNKFGHHLTKDDMRNYSFGKLTLQLDDRIVPSVISSLKMKIEKAVELETNQVFLHAGPHHDDIMLGYLPHIVHLIRSPLNTHHFAVLTSGFTSVSNNYLHRVLLKTKEFLHQGKIQMTQFPDFFKSGYIHKWDKDVFHYLDRVASNNKTGQMRGLSHRVVRALIEIYSISNMGELFKKIEEIIAYIRKCYDGEKNTPDIQRLKGMLREFEEELVWSHYGVQVKNVHHLRLGFYTGAIFNEIPDRSRDVKPVLDLLEKIQPTVLTLALDPEGSGPDTHYKVLQTLAEAVRLWARKRDLSNLRIWGYRNVWYRFHPAEANIIVPVSLNSMAVLRNTFMDCYLSQKEASFPSYELDGPFCDLTQKIWVEQHQLMELVLGRDYWYQNPHPRLRATHGVIFLRELDVDTFLIEAGRLEQSIEGQVT